MSLAYNGGGESWSDYDMRGSGGSGGMSGLSAKTLTPLMHDFVYDVRANQLRLRVSLNIGNTTHQSIKEFSISQTDYEHMPEDMLKKLLKETVFELARDAMDAIENLDLSDRRIVGSSKTYSMGAGGGGGVGMSTGAYMTAEMAKKDMKDWLRSKGASF